MNKYAGVKLLLIAVCLLFSTEIGYGKKPELQVDYQVSVRNLGEQLFQINSTIKNIEGEKLKLLFPMYRPGIFTTFYYFKHVGDIKITDSKGQKLNFSMPQRQVLLIDTGGQKEIKVSYYYKADILSGGEAYLDNDLGFFTGVHFFPQINDRRDIKSTVKFDLPPEWKVLTTLNNTDSPNAFQADNFYELADSQTMVGKFELTTFDVKGVPHYVATAPMGWYAAEKKERLVGTLKSISEVQADIFKEIPYKKYTYFYIFKQKLEGYDPEYLPEVQSADSHLHIVRPNEEFSDPARLLASAIHDHFHAWSLMRMRPVEYWNWNYAQDVDTRLLWFAEGITRYYMTVTRLRSKNGTRDDFFMRVNESVNTIKPNPSNEVLSLSDASILSAVRYQGILETDYSFVLGGHLIGLMLDLSIRHDTDSRYSLDDVMRILYQETYKQGRGYTSEDIRKVIERLTKRDYKAFFNDYIDGKRPFPYDEILGYAGYRVVKSVRERPTLGLLLEPADGGLVVTRVISSSLGEKAGFQRGDLVIKFDKLDVAKNGLAGAGDVIRENLGKSIVVQVKRNNEIKDLQLAIKNTSEDINSVVEVEAPTSEQIKLREIWLKQ